jgi:phosphoribosylamine-glycine ligase
MPLRILLAGRGPQAAALGQKFATSPLLGQLFQWPAPAADDAFGSSVDLSDDASPAQVAKWARGARLDLVILASEEAIASGLGNVLEIYRIPCFGPTAVAGHFHWDLSLSTRLPVAPATGVRAATLEECRAMARQMLQTRDGIVVRVAAAALGKLRVYCRSLKELDDLLEPVMRLTQAVKEVPVLTLEEDSGECESFHFFVHQDRFCSLESRRSLEANAAWKHRFRYFDTAGLAAKRANSEDEALAAVERQVLQPLLQAYIQDNISYTGWIKIDVRWSDRTPLLVDMSCLPSRAAVETLAGQDQRDWLSLIQEVIGLGQESQAA